MQRKILSSITTFCILFSAIDPAFAISDTERDLRFHIEKIKTKVREAGTGPSARVEVKLTDGTNLKGYIQDASNDSFRLVDTFIERVITIPYAQAREVKRQRNMKPFKIGVIVTGGILFILYVKAVRSD